MVVSVMLESLVLALVAGAIGGTVAYFIFNGFQAATMNWATFSMLTFAFMVTPQLLIQGIIWATVIGFMGGLFPAIRAARLPIAAALRAL